MTFLGKIFTLLTLLLSVVFFVAALLANSTHIRHKTSLATLQTKAKQLETTIDELKKKTEELQTARAQEIASRRLALAALQTQLEAARSELAQANKDLSDKSGTLTAQTQQLSEINDRVAILNRQNEALKSEADSLLADRNEQRRRVINLTDKVNGLESLKQDLEIQVSQLQQDATVWQARSETQKAALVRAGIRDPDDVPPAGLRGEVLGVDGERVVVSIGKDDGLREGHFLEVYRGGTYLGRIVIRSVKDDQATGEIVRSMRKGFIQPKDKVAAKLM